jgi:hypothetical protein
MEQLSEVLKIIGYKAPENLEDLDTKDVLKHVAGTYVARNEATQDPTIMEQVSGKLFGAQYGNLARLSGERFSKEALSKMEFSEAVQTVLGKFNEELEEAKKAKGDPSKELQAAQAKIDTLTKDIDTWKEQAADFENKFKETEANSAQTIRNFKLNSAKESVLRKISFKEGMTKMEQAGFNSLVDSFSWDLDEQDNLVVRTSDNKPIPSKEQGGTSATPAEVLTSLAKENDLLKQNNGQTGKTRTFTPEPGAKQVQFREKKSGAQAQ